MSWVRKLGIISSDAVNVRISPPETKLVPHKKYTFNVIVKGERDWRGHVF